MTSTDRRQALFFFAIAFFVLAAGFGLRDPWPADEPRFVLVAKQMVESGDFLFPHRGQELYPDKPPVYFWLLSAAFGLVGSWRWSFLLPSLLSAMGTLALTWDLGRRLWSPRAGLWAAIAVAVALQFVYQGKRAQIDPTLVFMTTLSFYGLCRHLLLGPHWRWWLAGCFMAGLGVVTKGVGFLPLLALLPFAFFARRRWQGVATMGEGHGWRWAAGALAFFVAIALWLVPVLAVGLSSGNPEHAEYLRNILFKQTAQRYADPWHHTEPFWYFGQVVLFFWLPFSLALPWLLKPWVRAWRERDARVWLPLAWVGDHVFSYGEAQRTSKNSANFGKGELEGIAASESANNGACGATMIPLLALGVPGDVITGVMLGARQFRMKTLTEAALPSASMTVSVDCPEPSGCHSPVRRRVLSLIGLPSTSALCSRPVGVSPSTFSSTASAAVSAWVVPGTW